MDANKETGFLTLLDSQVIINHVGTVCLEVLRRYYNGRSDNTKKHIDREIDVLVTQTRFTVIRAIRCMLLDIKLGVMEDTITAFSLTVDEMIAINQQLARMTRLKHIVEGFDQQHES